MVTELQVRVCNGFPSGTLHGSAHAPLCCVLQCIYELAGMHCGYCRVRDSEGLHSITLLATAPNCSAAILVQRVHPCQSDCILSCRHPLMRRVR